MNLQARYKACTGKYVVASSRRHQASFISFVLANWSRKSWSNWFQRFQLGRKRFEVFRGTLERIHAIGFYLCSGCEFASEGWTLAVHSFDLLHNAAATKNMPYEYWCMLKERLPTLAMWEKWDKCERLRRGLVEAFHKQKLTRLLETYQKR